MRQPITVRVFVSSTWLDLQEHREAVRAVIRQLGAVDVAMEHLGARDERPKAECLRLVREADAFVGIYAYRYGSVPDGEEVSITEAEYVEASSTGVKRLIYLVDEVAPWLPAYIDQGEHGERLANLKKRLLAAHVCKRFRGKDDLAAAVATDLGRELVFKLLPHVSPDGGQPELRSIPEWSKARNAIYRDARNVFLAHTLRPSKTKGQLFDIAIYLIPHRSNDPAYRREDLADVVKAEFFLGAFWGNRIISATESGGYIGISTSAYGPFLCVCRVYFRDGETALLSRYIDFEMGELGV